jgi:hypothetical protein
VLPSPADSPRSAASATWWLPSAPPTCCPSSGAGRSWAVLPAETGGEVLTADWSGWVPLLLPGWVLMTSLSLWPSSLLLPSLLPAAASAASLVKLGLMGTKPPSKRERVLCAVTSSTAGLWGARLEWRRVLVLFLWWWKDRCSLAWGRLPLRYLCASSPCPEGQS